jgi:uracil-DNA glycosylase family 4
MDPWSLSWKEEQYKQIKAAWRECSMCPLSKGRSRVVFGVGSLNAKIMLIGEAPGADEDKRGEPFVGKAGELLTVMLEEVGLRRDEIFLDNIVSCRPPQNRDPLVGEKDACLTRLNQVIYLIDPLLIVAVGKSALTTLVGGRSFSIESEHGRLFSSPHPSVRITGEKNGATIPGHLFPKKGSDKKEYTLDYDLVGIYHPSYILRTDSPDPTTGQYELGRPAHQTIEDLRSIVDRVTQLEREYENQKLFIERNINEDSTTTPSHHP